MGVEVRCGCGQVVVADVAHRGQVVQCPHCQAGVAVPVAAAGRGPPPTAEQQRAAAVAQVALGLVVAAAGFFFLWDGPLGKLLVLGGVFTAGEASRRL